MKKQYKVINVKSNEVLFTGTNWGKANQFAYDMLTQESGIGVNLQIFEVGESCDILVNDWIGYKYSTGKIRMTKKEVADRLMKNSNKKNNEEIDNEALAKKAAEEAEAARLAEKEAIRKQKKREADARYRAKKKAQKLAALAAMNIVK